MTRRRRGTTALPPARIKKIMQCDEDVGKIATATPTLVAKALECLVEDLLRDAAILAISKSAKTVQPAHLAEVINDTDTFDFLRHIAADVPRAQSKKPKRPRAHTPPPPKKNSSKVAGQVSVVVPTRKKVRPLLHPPHASPVAVTAENDSDTTAILNLASLPLPPRAQNIDINIDVPHDEEDDDYDGIDDDDENNTATIVTAKSESQACRISKVKCNNNNNNDDDDARNGCMQSPSAQPSPTPPQSSSHRISVLALIS